MASLQLRATLAVVLLLAVTDAGVRGLEFGAWFYDNDHVLYSDAKVVAVSKHYSLNFLYYSLSVKKCSDADPAYDSVYESSVVDRILLLDANGVKTKLYLLQDVGFLDGTYGSTAWVSHIDAADNFLSRHPLVASAVTGIHFDLEPHQSSDWATNQTSLFTSFMSLLGSIGSYVRDGSSVPNLAGLGLSIDIPHWFGGQQYALATGFPTALLQYNYTVAFMIYEGIGDELADFSTADNELAEIPGIIGIGAMEFPGAIRDMVAMRAAVVDRFVGVHGSQFMGVTFYHFRQLEEAYHPFLNLQLPSLCTDDAPGGFEELWEEEEADRMRTGGLGHLMDDRFEVWACVFNNTCSRAHGSSTLPADVAADFAGADGALDTGDDLAFADWTCYVYDELHDTFVPWGLNSDLRLFSPSLLPGM